MNKQDLSPAYIFTRVRVNTLLFQFYLDSFDKNSGEYYTYLESPPPVPCHFKRLELAQHVWKRGTKSHNTFIDVYPCYTVRGQISLTYAEVTSFFT